MASRIEHWERKYRVSAPTAASRLDAIAVPVLAAYENQIQSALGDSDEVILVRAAHVCLTLLPDAHTQAELARLWGQSMAAAVLRAVADADADNVARFPDRAAHLAAFVTAAASGSADDWKFARF